MVRLHNTKQIIQFMYLGTITLGTGIIEEYV